LAVVVVDVTLAVAAVAALQLLVLFQQYQFLTRLGLEATAGHRRLLEERLPQLSRDGLCLPQEVELGAVMVVMVG
jgi:hypothetical protein